MDWALCGAPHLVVCPDGSGLNPSYFLRDQGYKRKFVILELANVLNYSILDISSIQRVHASYLLFLAFGIYHEN